MKAHLLVIDLPLCDLLDDPVVEAVPALHDEPLVWMLLGKDEVYLRDGEDPVSASVALDHCCMVPFWHSLACASLPRPWWGLSWSMHRLRYGLREYQHMNGAGICWKGAVSVRDGHGNLAHA